MSTMTRSIGTNARDYSTISAWEADLDNTGIYSGGDHAVGECYDDSVFDESVTIDGGVSVGLGGVTLTVPESERHDGTAGTGARLSASGADRAMISLTGGSNFPRHLAWLEHDGNGNIHSSGGLFTSSPFSIDMNFSGRHLLLHDVGNSNRGIANQSGGGKTIIHNCIIYRMLSGFSGGAKGLNRTNGDVEALNVTVHDIVSTHSTADANCYAVANSTSVLFNNLGTSVSANGSATVFSSATPTSSHNASSDGTAPGGESLTNIAASDQYVSTVVGSEDLRIKRTADVFDMGADLSYTGNKNINISIEGRDRLLQGQRQWSIGASEPAPQTTASPRIISPYLIGDVG